MKTISCFSLCSALLLASCSPSGSAPTTTRGLERDRQFIDGLMQMYPDSPITGLQALEAGYQYCTDIVEGARLSELYDRIDLMDEKYQSIHRSIVDLSINTICFLEES